jgi:hypothetical protein
MTQKLPVKLLPSKLIFGFVFLACVQINQVQANELPLDLIELLGELNDEDDALDVALTEIELKKSKEATQPNEVKK